MISDYRKGKILKRIKSLTIQSTGRKTPAFFSYRALLSMSVVRQSFFCFVFCTGDFYR